MAKEDSRNLGKGFLCSQEPSTEGVDDVKVRLLNRNLVQPEIEQHLNTEIEMVQKLAYTKIMSQVTTVHSLVRLCGGGGSCYCQWIIIALHDSTNAGYAC
jgi:hypothetical protein